MLFEGGGDVNVSCSVFGAVMEDSINKPVEFGEAPMCGSVAIRGVVVILVQVISKTLDIPVYVILEVVKVESNMSLGFCENRRVDVGAGDVDVIEDVGGDWDGCCRLWCVGLHGESISGFFEIAETDTLIGAIRGSVGETGVIRRDAACKNGGLDEGSEGTIFGCGWLHGGRYRPGAKICPTSGASEVLRHGRCTAGFW